MELQNLGDILSDGTQENGDPDSLNKNDRKLRKEHPKKLKNTNKELPDEEKYCQPCSKKLSNAFFYKAHLGTKTHKRNVRVHPGVPKSTRIVSKEGPFVRKKYKTRNYSTERKYFTFYQSYINFLTSYLSLRLALDPNVEDFNISVNDKKWHSFGDIVIDVTHKDKNTIYAIKCKQVTNRGNKTIESLKQAKVILEKEYINLSVLKNNEGFASAKFLIVTPCSVSFPHRYTEEVSHQTMDLWKTETGALPKTDTVLTGTLPETDTVLTGTLPESNTVLTRTLLDTDTVLTRTLSETDTVLTGAPPETDTVLTKNLPETGTVLTGTLPETDTFFVKPSKRSELIDVSQEPSNVYSIFPKNLDDSYKFPSVFFYANQIVFPPIFDSLLKDKIESFRGIHQKYVEYIEKWAGGKLGGYYHLNKRDVLVKIAEIILKPYVIYPKKIRQTGQSDFEIWQKIIERVDLTILKRQNHITSMTSEPFNRIIEKILDKFDIVSKTINITDEIIENIKDPSVKAYLFEECDFTNSSKYEIPLSKIYTIFWKSGKIPLLLATEEDIGIKIIIDTINFMKKNGINRKFILKTNQSWIPNKKLRLFTCLEDVKELVDLEKVTLRISDDYFLSLKKISSSDPFFLKWITPNRFFYMAQGHYSMRKTVCDEENRLDDLKIILDEESREITRYKLYGKDYKNINQGRLRGVDLHLL